MEHKMTTFIVEDDPIYSSILESNLRKEEDLEVFTYASGEEMLENLHLNPEIVILDHNLEQLTGIEVLQKIRASNPTAAVVFVSGQENTDVAVNSLKFGAVDYIVKNETSITKLKEILEKIRQQKRDEGSKSKRQSWFKRIIS